MAIYNFKKELKLYIVYAGLKYPLDIYPDITFSQTFSETAVPVKTLHSQTDMFENAVITKANPANFSFTTPILLDGDINIVLQLLADYDTTSTEATLKTADLYVEMNTGVYKLEKAVFEQGTFQIQRNQFITVSVTGTAKKLQEHVGAIPGTLTPRLSGTGGYAAPTSLEIKIGSNIQTNISSVSLELANNVQWVDYTTLQNSLGISSASQSMTPEAFVVGSRTFSGNVQQYVTDETDGNVSTWEIGQPLYIRTGNLNSAWLLDVELPSIVYTKRPDLQDLLMQSYDFRLNSNPTSMAEVIKYLRTSSNLGEYSGIWAAI